MSSSTTISTEQQPASQDFSESNAHTFQTSTQHTTTAMSASTIIQTSPTSHSINLQSSHSSQSISSGSQSTLTTNTSTDVEAPPLPSPSSSTDPPPAKKRKKSACNFCRSFNHDIRTCKADGIEKHKETTLDIAVVNAYICFRDWEEEWGIETKKPLKNKDFRLSLMRQIIDKYSEKVDFPLQLHDLLIKVDTQRRIRQTPTTNNSNPPTTTQLTPTPLTSVDFTEMTLHDLATETTRVKNGTKQSSATRNGVVRQGVCIECAHLIPPYKDGEQEYRRIKKSLMTPFYCTHPMCHVPSPRTVKSTFRPYLHPKCINNHYKRIYKLDTPSNNI